MKLQSVIFFIFISCTSIINRDDRYEIAFKEISQNSQNSTPFLSDFGSDASGTKIMTNVYDYKGIYKNIITDKVEIKSNTLKNLSSKYSRIDWRADIDYKLLMPEEVKEFHGPVNYIYFSNIKNDTLKAQILSNPNGKYELGTVSNFLIVFDKNKIKSVKKWNDHYE